uniref:DNA polymerase kappa n=1 Tax=Setaria digitata TaxID=48799 RepID=A0A915Q6K7_9BILA
MMDFNDNKAGMTGIDKERVQKIINDNTSPSFEGHAKKRKQRIDARIKRYKDVIDKLTLDQIHQAQAEMDILVHALEEERDLSHYAVHVDMDAFYAAVEMRDDPSLRSIPIAVGSDSMLSTSNYTARRFGVRAAMPGFIAKKLCPQLKIIPGCLEKYRQVSSVAREIFRDYDPDFCAHSLDEAYMDLTTYVRNRSHTVEHERIRYMGECVCRLPLVAKNEINQLANAEITDELCTRCKKLRKCIRDRVTFGMDIDEIVREMRFRVEQAVGLTCSAGTIWFLRIAPNFMLAKVCSDINKPNGQFHLLNEREAILTFMKDLPIRKISGIGPVTEAVLKGIGLEKCGDLYERRGVLENLCNELVDSLSDHKIRGGRAVTVKMKFSTFNVITSVDYVVSDVDRLFTLCSKLVRQEMCDGHADNKYLRLLGIRLTRLVFEDEKVQSSNLLYSFWKRQETNSAEMEYVNDTLNDSLLPPARVSKSDNTIGSASKPDDISEVVCFDAQPCPICQVTLSKDLALVNRHIDECLNRQAISELRDIPNTTRATVKCENPKDMPSKRRIVKRKVSKISKNSLDNYFAKRPTEKQDLIAENGGRSVDDNFNSVIPSSEEQLPRRYLRIYDSISPVNSYNTL